MLPQEGGQREGLPLDPLVWKAFAGAARVPAVGSLVYYFPQGHAEQAISPPDFSAASFRARSRYLCRISGVRLLASPETDEVFARVDLHPCAPPPSGSSPESSVEEAEDGDGTAVRSFPKVLTSSDANNGGGFSVPRYCAENIFPRLDTTVADPPLQMLVVRDVHGTPWEFRHIFRGTPRRHLLTTGWSKFVNCKQLIAGDSVVFVRSREGELFVGVRRAVRSFGGGVVPAAVRYTSPATGVELKMDEKSMLRQGYWRGVKGRVPSESVVEAVRRAEIGAPFEVVYYPRVGSPEFLVPAAAVDEAMAVPWAVGLPVRMGIDSDDSSRTTWYQGTVSSISLGEQGLWPLSPWRALQVTWDEPQALPHIKSVNPWQVESLSLILQLPNSYPATKKIRLPQGHELFGDGENNLFFPATGISNMVVGGLGPPPSIGPTIFPAGMQGARHESLGVSNLLMSGTPESSYRMDLKNPCNTDDMAVNAIDISLGLGGSSTSGGSSPRSRGSIYSCPGEPSSYPKYPCSADMAKDVIDISLNLGGSSLSGSSSPPSRGSIYSCAGEDFRTLPCKSKNAASLGFKLFGQMIMLEGPTIVGDELDICSNKGERNSATWAREFSRKRKATHEDDGISYSIFTTDGEACYPEPTWRHD